MTRRTDEFTTAGVGSALPRPMQTSDDEKDVDQMIREVRSGAAPARVLRAAIKARQ